MRQWGATVGPFPAQYGQWRTREVDLRFERAVCTYFAWSMHVCSVHARRRTFARLRCATVVVGERGVLPVSDDRDPKE